MGTDKEPDCDYWLVVQSSGHVYYISFLSGVICPRTMLIENRGATEGAAQDASVHGM